MQFYDMYLGFPYLVIILYILIKIYEIPKNINLHEYVLSVDLNFSVVEANLLINFVLMGN